MTTSLSVHSSRGTEIERIIAAKQSVQVRSMEQSLLKREITEAIITANKITGQATSAEKINTESDLICEMITNDYPYLAVGEITIAASIGAYGKFGDFFGINPKTFKQWIEGHRLSHEAKKAARILEEIEYRKQKIKTQIDIPNKDEYYNYLCSEGGKRNLNGQEIDFKIAYSLQKEFNEHSIGEIVKDPQNVYYNFLDKNEIIAFTTEHKNKAIKLAEQGQIVLKSTSKLDEALNQLYCIQLNKIHFLAKCYLLSQYFDDCKRKNINPFEV